MLVTNEWLKSNYAKYNTLLFDGKLPNIPLKITNGKNRWGYASYRVNHRLKCLTPTGISISNYYDSPENVKLNTLVHEMIHIYDYISHPTWFYDFDKCKFTTKRTYDAHGFFFQSECERVNKITGLHVNTHVTSEEMNVSKKRAGKVKPNKEETIIFVINGDIISFIFKTCNSHFEEVINTIDYIGNYWESYLGSSIKSINIYSTNDNDLIEKRSCAKKLKGHKTAKPEIWLKEHECKPLVNNYMTHRISYKLNNLIAA